VTGRPGRWRGLPEGTGSLVSPPALGLGVVGQLAGVGLVGTSAWLVVTASLRPPVLMLSTAIAAVRLFALLRGAARYGERLVAHASALRLLGRLRVWAFARLEPLVPGVLPARRGDVLARVVADVERAGDLAVRVVGPLAALGASTVLSVALVATLDRRAGVVLGAGCVLAALLATGVHRGAGTARLGRPAELRGRRDAALLEVVQAAPDLVAFGRAGEAVAALGRTEAELDRATRAATAPRDLAELFVAAIAGVTTAAVVAVVAPTAATAGAPAPAVLALVALVTLTAVDGLVAVPDAAATGALAAAGLARVVELGEPAAPPRPLVVAATGTTPRTATRARGGQPGGAARALATPAIVVDDVTVVRDRARGPVLEAASLEVAVGECVGLVGPSGAGKTTIAELVLGFLEPTTGSVLVLGEDPAVAAAGGTGPPVAWSPQDPPVFATTVRANLALARPEADDGALHAILTAVGLADWLGGLGAGLDTVLAERGTSVSGGERQRLGVARALLADRPVLVLDEPTAHLDEASAAALTAAVQATLGGRSCLWITHEATDYRAFDRVVALEPAGVTWAAAAR
jgi:thiol reductant ABC exporter CydC subunit